MPDWMLVGLMVDLGIELTMLADCGRIPDCAIFMGHIWGTFFSYWSNLLKVF
jgi:hypothetical protein